MPGKADRGHVAAEYRYWQELNPMNVAPRSRLYLALLFVLLAATVPRAARADFLLVDASCQEPGYYCTIAEALAAAADGDQILVGSGLYFEPLDFQGKSILLRSMEGPSVTIIENSIPFEPAIRLSGGEGIGTVIQGFTIRSAGEGIQTDNGASAEILGNVFDDCAEGGLVARNVATPFRIEGNTFRRCGIGIAVPQVPIGVGPPSVIQGNVFVGNENRALSTDAPVLVYVNRFVDNPGLALRAEMRYSPEIIGNVFLRNGGAVALSGPTNGFTGAESFIAVVAGNWIEGNHARNASGAGVAASGYGWAYIRNNIIVGNQADREGGGIWTGQYTRAHLDHNTIIGNHADRRGGGIYLHSRYANALCTNLIVRGNTSPEFPQVGVRFPAPELEFFYSNIEGGTPFGASILDADPLFVDAANADYHLRLGSPCIDAGLDFVELQAPVDFDRDSRTLDGDFDGVAITDMGADEVDPGVAARYGTVDAANGSVASSLFVNGSAGDERRIVRVQRGEALTLSVESPPSGPDPAAFVLYAWLAISDGSTVRPQPFGTGFMCLPSPLDVDPIQPDAIWNNIGKEARLGTPDFPSDPAPSVPLDRPSGIGRVEVTFQGLIQDAGSQGSRAASVTNAVVLIVE